MVERSTVVFALRVQALGLRKLVVNNPGSVSSQEAWNPAASIFSIMGAGGNGVMMEKDWPGKSVLVASWTMERG